VDRIIPKDLSDAHQLHKVYLDYQLDDKHL